VIDSCRPFRVVDSCHSFCDKSSDLSAAAIWRYWR
jgi:hypothetical protein